jgi:SAM-dependent methyltransferase
MFARRHRKVFGRIYGQRTWGNEETVSGPGSGIERTAELREVLPRLFEELRVETLLDAGCGDFHWLRLAELPIKSYIGVEVVPQLVTELEASHGSTMRSFRAADITRDRLPTADLVLCRDVLIHFPDRDVLRAIENFARSARWLLTTTFVDRERNDPIELGDWRTLNLQVRPFDFPPPLRLIDDVPLIDRELYLDKRLALWELSGLI